MRFYRVTTPHSQDEIDNIIMSMSQAEVDYVISLYGKISMVEYTDEMGHECMYAILDDFLSSKIHELYQKYSIRFNLTDLTKDIIFDNKIKMNYRDQKKKSVKSQISNLIDEFKMNWVTKDDILDKIIEKGIDSLTKIDLEILKS